MTFVETASEALALSIGEKARVDLSYMARLTCRSEEEIIKELQGVIYKVPSSEPARYVTADENRFLIVVFVINIVKDTGVTEIQSVLHDAVGTCPLRAVSAVRLDVPHVGNVAALEKVIPKDLPASEISVRLGTTWIPQEDIQQFMVDCR